MYNFPMVKTLQPWAIRSIVSCGIVMATLATPLSAQASTLYVSNSGKDSSSNPYSTNTPFYSLEKAADWSSAGDTIKLRGGTYKYTKGQYIGKSGTSSSRITIQSYDNERAVLDGSNLSGDLLVIGGSYVTVQNLEVKNSKKAGITIYGGANNLIYNCSVSNSQSSGIFIGYDDNNLSSTPCYNNKVDSCSLWNNCRLNSARTPGTIWPIALHSEKARNTQFINCDVYNNWGEGIGASLTNGGYIGYNRSHDNYSVNIYLDNATNVSVEQNRVINLGLSAYTRNGKPANGIGLANEWYDIANPLNSNTVIYNYAENCPQGIFYGAYDNYNAGLKNTTITNNTFKNCTRNVAIDYSPGNSGNNIQSN